MLYANANTNTDAKISKKMCTKVPEHVRLDEKLLLRYTSSLMRLLIFMGHCGPSHPCTMNEIRLLRRYDEALVARHAALNARQDHAVIMRALADRSVEIGSSVAATLDLEPEFVAEILADFAKTVKNRFSG